MAAPNKGFEGLDKTLKNLEHVELNLASCVRTACWRLGGKILMAAKERARKGGQGMFTGTPSEDPDPGTPTGRLRGSLTMRANFGQQAAGLKSPAESGDAVGKPGGSGKDDPVVVVGTNVKYAPFVEFGTRKMHERPILYPAFFENEDDFERVFIDTVEKKAALRNFNQRLPIFDPEGSWE